jgi:hemoglobin
MSSKSLQRLSLAILMMTAAASGPKARADDTLYRDLGGRATLERIVDGAVAMWVTDARIAQTFDNLNLDRFKRRLTDQLCELAGGPCRYTGRNMYLTHKGLHLDIVEFNALVEDLQDAMNQVRVPFRTQNRLLAILAPMKRDIVTR